MDLNDERLPDLPGDGSHVHSIDRCEHEIAGDEVAWQCGKFPMFTNVATARAIGDDEECSHLSATGIDQMWDDRKVWRCDACGWAFKQVTVDGITRMIPAGWPQRMVEVDR